jgi:ABC-type lipoprotein release transport system permease subunit
MTTFLIIAWRNILRNRRRSLITVSSIGFGLGAMLFLWGYIDGAHLQLKENFTGLFMGHLQIHAQGFEKTKSLIRVIKNPAPLETTLRSRSEISAYTARVRTFAFFRAQENSFNGLLVGIDPIREPKVSKIGSTIRLGRFLQAGETGAIVLGASLAETLNVTLGDRVVSTVQETDGRFGDKAFLVVGTVKTGVEEIDKGMALVTLADAQTMLGLGGGITDIVLHIHNLSRLEQFVRALRKQLSEGDLEIMTWSELSPILQQWIDFDEAIAYVFLLIVLVVIIAGILNTILMAMLERTREFGVMLALGTKGYQLAFMVGAESFLLGLIGLGAGITLGLSSVGIFAYLGVPVGADVKEAFANFFISDVVYPMVVWNHLLSNSLIVIVSCILISLYPAWKVSRLKPAKAMSTV